MNEIEIEISSIGPQGLSAYEVWLQEGHTGTEEEYIASLKGEKGDKGDTYELTEQDKKDISELTVKSSESSFNTFYNSKVSAFDSNATEKTNTFNEDVESKTSTFDSNYETKTTTFNNNATSKTNTFNSNVESKTTTFNSNATEKTTTFNQNVNTKTTEFNTNATDKTTAFNNNATSKTTAFDTNATDKTTEFNTNAETKTTEFNSTANAERITYLEKIINGGDIENGIRNYFALTPDYKIYTVRFPMWATSNTCQGEKLDDNAGLVCTPGTDTVREVSTYGEAWESYDCNAVVDDNGVRHITALKGMSNYRDTGKVDVFCLFRTYYQKIWEEDGYLYISRSFVPKDGYTVVSQAINKDGTINNWFTIGKYVVGDIEDDNGTHKLYSSKGLIPAHYINNPDSEEEISDGISHTGCISLFRAKGSNYYSAGMMADYMHILTTFYLKFATKNTQSIMAGNTSNSAQYKVAQAESNVSRVILTTAQAANFDINTYVSVGDPTTNTNLDRVYGYMHDIAYDVKIIGKEVIDSTKTALILDYDTFTTTETTYVSTMHERSGYSDDILGRTGSVGSNTNGKHGMVLDGIEIMVGGNEVVGNAFLNIINSAGTREVYYTNDVSKLTTNITTAMSTYSKSDLTMKSDSINGWKSITRMDFDVKNGIALQTECGQSGSGTSVGYADSVYFDNASSGQRELLLLGNLDNATHAGLSRVSANRTVSSSYWNILARLSINGVGGELAE